MDKCIEELNNYASWLCYDHLPEKVVHECKRRLVDSLACAIGAFDEEASRIARRVARRYVGKPAARIWGTLEETSAEHAAFVNGAMTRCEDYNDAYFSRSSGHPSDLVGALFGMGEILNAGGRDVIEATVLAYEVYCNFSDILQREQGWDYPLHTVVASAAAASKMLKLDATRFQHAIALAITPNLPLEQTRWGQLSMWKGAAGANAARNGVFAALLAAEGFTGPDQAFTGRAGLWNQVPPFEWAPFGGKGGPFRVTQTHIKYYPALIHGQSAITATLELRKGIDIDQIEAISVETYWVAERYLNRSASFWYPQTRETADHSIAYVIAVALLDGDVNKGSYEDERIRDPRVRSLLDKMTFSENPAFTKMHPSEWPFNISILLKNGERKTVRSDYFLGHVKNPLTDEQLRSKFFGLWEGKLDAAHTKAACDALFQLEKAGSVKDVVSLFKVTHTDE